MNLELLQTAFSTTTVFNPNVAIVQMVALIVLSSLLSVVYLFRGNSLSNRARIAALLPLMALTTMLIISIVKSSLALSLGLVGALSIVRFRAAIKDPEELAYIFLSIALGLGFGADQAVMSSTFFAVILTFILLQSLFKGGLSTWFTDRDSVHLEVVFTKNQELLKVLSVLDKHASKVKLVRLDEGEKQIMRFLVKPTSELALDEVTTGLHKLDAKATVSFLQYQPLA